MELCKNFSDFGGRGFKKALIQKILQEEDSQFLEEINLRMNTVKNGKIKAEAASNSEGIGTNRFVEEEDNYNSAEDSFADDQYEYYDFENK